MEYIIEGMKKALYLIFTLDAELLKIVELSLRVSYSATFISSVIFVPIGILLGLHQFRFKKILEKLLYTLMGVPTVVIGLVVAIIFSRKGPMGFIDLMYTSNIMIIAQAILIAPLILSLTFNIVGLRGRKIYNIGRTLGANSFQNLFLVISEMRLQIMVILVSAFSRAISEVGTVMIVGGNIKGHTRVMTTAIAMYNSMGEYEMAIALGIILLLLAFANNFLVLYLENKTADK